LALFSSLKIFFKKIAFFTESKKRFNMDTKMIIAMVLSFIFPGLGLLYLGDMKKGGILLALGIIFYLLYLKVFQIFGLVVFIIWIYSLYLTYQEAKVA
jgi:hypothetical protein